MANRRIHTVLQPSRARRRHGDNETTTKSKTHRLDPADVDGIVKALTGDDECDVRHPPDSCASVC